MAARESVVRFKAKNPYKLVKWKIHVGSRLSYGTVLFLFEQLYSEETKDRPKQYQKFKSNVEGTVKCLIAKEGSTVHPGCELLELQACMHQVVMKDMCAECGADLRRLDSDNLAKVVAATSVSMIHSVPELRVSHERAQLLGQADEERLLKNRKLVLLVDLDQTLIHTTNENVAPNMKDVHHFQLYGPHSPWYHTKIRPRTSDFLKNISQLYELHICTFGARAYAHHIASLLDHDGKYFSHRILSRDECFNTTSKTGNLKALFPCGDSLVCIIDDREDVWNFSPNLIPVKPYHFFSHTGDINAPFGMEKSVQRQEYQPEEEGKCDFIGRQGFPNIRDIFVVDDGKIEPITPVASEGEDEKQDVCHQARNGTAKTDQKKKSTAIDAIALKDKLVQCQVEDTEAEKTEESQTVEDSDPNKENNTRLERKDGVVEELKCLNDKVVQCQVEGAEPEKMEESQTIEDNICPENKDNNELNEINSLKDKAEDAQGTTARERQTVKECINPDSEPEKMEESQTIEDNICPENKSNNELNEINCLKDKAEDANITTAGENQTVKECINLDTVQDAELNIKVLKDKVVVCFGKTSEEHPEESQSEKQSIESVRCKLKENRKERNSVEECIEKMLDVAVSVSEESKSVEEIEETTKGSNEKMETKAENSALMETCKAEPEIGGVRCHNDSESVDDSDDYLFYLEEILTMIHQAFYDMYDQMKAQKRNEIPDLKTVIPYVQRKVLKGTSLVLSGLIPTNVEVEKSKLWILAKSLGAIVTKDLTTKPGQCTTHVVAAKLGTAKVNKARRMKGMHIVNPDWLYCCAERWEHVDERLFPLRDGIVYKKHPYRTPTFENQMQRYLKHTAMLGQRSDTTTSGEPCPVYDPVTGKRIGLRQQKQVKSDGNHRAAQRSSGKRLDAKKDEERFSESFSPLLSFSTAEIEQMGREVDDACSEDSNNVDDSDSEEGTAKPKNSGSDSSTGESLSGGECPKGWKKRKRDTQDEYKEEFGGVIFCEDDVPQTKCKRREFPTDSENSNKSNSEEDGESIGSVDEEMAAAVEREFLSC